MIVLSPRQLKEAQPMDEGVGGVLPVEYMKIINIISFISDLICV